MKNLLKILVLHTSAIYMLSQAIPAFGVSKNINSLIIASVILIFFLKAVKPILNIFMLPINLVTLNLTVWISDVLLVYIWTLITPGITISSWDFPGTGNGIFMVNPMNLAPWQVTLVCSILLILVIKLLNWICK